MFKNPSNTAVAEAPARVPAGSPATTSASSIRTIVSRIESQYASIPESAGTLEALRKKLEEAKAAAARSAIDDPAMSPPEMVALRRDAADKVEFLQIEVSRMEEAHRDFIYRLRLDTITECKRIGKELLAAAEVKKAEVVRELRGQMREYDKEMRPGYAKYDNTILWPQYLERPEIQALIDNWKGVGDRRWLGQMLIPGVHNGPDDQVIAYLISLLKEAADFLA